MSALVGTAQDVQALVQGLGAPLEEYRRARDVLSLSSDALVDLAAASIDASFASPATKRRLLQHH